MVEAVGVGIAPVVDAHQPALVAPANDLTLLSGQDSSLFQENAAHIWHTGLVERAAVDGAQARCD